jgi:hypothetical protein
MLNTYIKNRGTTKTIVHDSSNLYRNNNHFNAVNEIKWDADYDGDVANISITSDTNGDKKQFNISLDNNDLEHILNIPSVDIPIHKRLKMDFSKPIEPTIYKIELPEPHLKPEIQLEPEPHLKPEIQLEPEIQIQSEEPIPMVPLSFDNKKINSLEQLLEPSKRYLSTPQSNEELIIPLSVNKKDFYRHSTPRRRHRNKKTHKTYKVYKKHKTFTPKKHSSKVTSRRNSIRSIF